MKRLCTQHMLQDDLKVLSTADKLNQISVIREAEIYDEFSVAHHVILTMANSLLACLALLAPTSCKNYD